MSKTALQLVQAACYGAGITAPSALVSATDASTLQLLNLFYETGEELRSTAYWPQLKRRHTIVLQAGRNQYPLPFDFYRALPATQWDQQNRWEMRGPMGDSDWNYRTYGYVTTENRKGFRIFGPDQSTSSTQGQFIVDPIPGASSAGQMITFEYMTKSWLTPPEWIASTSYTGTTSYMTVNGNIYRCATAGAHNSGTVAPSVGFAGIGRDGGVYWMALSVSAWGSGTLYGPGEYVTNGGNLYLCITGGTSAGSGGPTGTSTSITDNTVTWQYCSVTAWAGETTFATNSFCSTGGNYYKAVTPPNTLTSSQITGKTAPTWVVAGATWKETDGSTSWNYQTAAYEALVTDSDLCLFDDDLMKLGLKWRFKREKRFAYEDFQAEYESRRQEAAARFNSGAKLTLAGSINRAPIISEGNFGV